MIVLLAVALVCCVVWVIKLGNDLSERARLAEGKYEALSKLNGDVPRVEIKPNPELLASKDSQIANLCWRLDERDNEVRGLRADLAKVQQSEREWHETALQNEAGLRKAQSELEAYKATPTRSEPCPWCKKTFDSRAQRRSHIQFHHDSEYAERNP